MSSGLASLSHSPFIFSLLVLVVRGFGQHGEILEPPIRATSTWLPFPMDFDPPPRVIRFGGLPLRLRLPPHLVIWLEPRSLLHDHGPPEAHRVRVVEVVVVLV